MFGIGAGEMLILGLVLVVVVGPNSMPRFIKSVGRALREFRAASDELRKQAGIDELLKDDPIGVKSLANELTRPAQTAPKPKPMGKLSDKELRQERPSEGADVAFAIAALDKKKAIAAERAAAEARIAAASQIADEDPEEDPDAFVGPISREDGEEPDFDVDEDEAEEEALS